MKKQVLLFAFLFILYSNLTTTIPAKLDLKEAKAMKQIGEKFGKKKWDLSMDPCNGNGIWNENDVECDCAYENHTICHLTHIRIMFENLSTTLPVEFADMKELTDLLLDNNNLSGTIPSEWAHIPFNILSLTGNRLSGPFPIALTKMTTLNSLYIDTNCFSGSIPKEIANLENLEKLVLSSNGFTGELPIALAKLTNLNSLIISDNNFSGKIPDFISKWTQIKELRMEGCSFKGPIPPEISALTQLKDLRISNLKGGPSTFPRLENLIDLETLVLRNCLIHGTIPDYVGNLINLITLDLSFNNLTGNIPSSFSALETDYIYLTENNLSGPIPEWVFSTTKTVDLSYNQFTWDDSAPTSCKQLSINTVESYSLSTNKQNNIAPCLRKDFPCTKSKKDHIHSLHINCGGEEVKINNTIVYESDKEKSGASTYHNAGNWAFSSTGKFLDTNPASYIHSNASNLKDIPASDVILYTKARTSAISLTYYGLCLMNGNYTVKLHFAEIVFNPDEIFTKLGKRVFDVYVQGELKLKDFDIVKEAGGTGIAVIKSYTVNVKNNTLKIRLYWAGKGTTDIPYGGIYGPIISAISVDADFEIPKIGKKFNVGLIVGTVGGGLLFVILCIYILWRKGYIMRGTRADTETDENKDTELTDINLQTRIFPLTQLKDATDNFDPKNKLGEGGFGVVYKGVLSDETKIAVKQLSSKSKQGATEFINELAVISNRRHPNLVRLYGCCIAGEQMNLVYEYMENNCLSRVLFGEDKVSKAKLTWSVRVNICKGIARGLLYLHEESNLAIIHRDIKPSNILLDEDFNAKIADFGLAKLNEDDNTQIITRVAGTIGYMAPEYAMRGCLTAKADIYSFGVVILEIVSGKSNSYQKKCGDDTYFLREWALKGNLLDVVDPDLGTHYSSQEAEGYLKLALLCTETSYNDRPTISEISKLLDDEIEISDVLKGKFSSTSYPKDNNRSWQDRSENRLPYDEEYTTSFVEPSVITELS